jgi:hypothetical protein
MNSNTCPDGIECDASFVSLLHSKNLVLSDNLLAVNEVVPAHKCFVILKCS